MSDRILVVGIEAEGERIDRADFDGEATLNHGAGAVVDPAAVPALWSQLPSDPAERAETGERLVELLHRRRQEATELLARGGTLVCILRPLGQPFRVPRHGQKGAALLHAYSWLPQEPSLAGLVVAAAQPGELRAADESHPLWPVLRSHGRPVACALNAPPPPNWHAIATDTNGRLVAFEVRVGQGSVLFVPPLVVASPAELGALFEQVFSAPAAAPVRPQWLDSVLLPGQAELAERLAELARKIEAMEREFIAARGRHAHLVRLNRLLSARTAVELADPAEVAFRELGFDVEAVGANALELRSAEGNALVVLAASDGPVDSEAYWDLVHQMDDGPRKVAKGIILANAFCTILPAERGGAFPDLLCRGALHREVCLLSTVELHTCMAALLERPDDAVRRALRTALLGTTGPCPLRDKLPSAGKIE